VFEYYTTKAWNFSNLKIEDIRGRMNETEKKIYTIDGEGLDVKEYLKGCMLCVRRNNLKEFDDTLPAARRHMKMYGGTILTSAFW
jgi:fatty acyl-CoA reductase